MATSTRSSELIDHCADRHSRARNAPVRAYRIRIHRRGLLDHLVTGHSLLRTEMHHHHRPGPLAGGAVHQYRARQVRDLVAEAVDHLLRQLLTVDRMMKVGQASGLGMLALLLGRSSGRRSSTRTSLGTAPFVQNSSKTDGEWRRCGSAHCVSRKRLAPQLIVSRPGCSRGRSAWR